MFGNTLDAFTAEDTRVDYIRGSCYGMDCAVSFNRRVICKSKNHGDILQILQHLVRYGRFPVDPENSEEYRAKWNTSGGCFLWELNKCFFARVSTKIFQMEQEAWPS